MLSFCCFSIPKLTYTLRSAPCNESQLLSGYDDVIRSTLQDILNVSLSEDVWNQVTLPVANSGLGIRRASHIALPAFLSSVIGSRKLITDLLPQYLHATSGTNDPTFTAAVRVWRTRAGSSPVQSPFPAAQKVWDTPLVNVHEAKVMSAALDQASKARLLAAAAPHSGRF